eukprot:Pgem_evm1s677
MTREWLWKRASQELFFDARHNDNHNTRHGIYKNHNKNKNKVNIEQSSSYHIKEAFTILLNAISEHQLHHSNGFYRCHQQNPKHSCHSLKKVFLELLSTFPFENFNGSENNWLLRAVESFPRRTGSHPDVKANPNEDPNEGLGMAKANAKQEQLIMSASASASASASPFSLELQKFSCQNKLAIIIKCVPPSCLFNEMS